MEDPRRFLSLRSVAMLRELVRRWWRLEVGLTDPAGRVLSDTWRPVPPDGNDFCRAVRSSSRGQRRCLKSVREIQQRLRRNPRERSPLAHTCHLGLSMAAAAIRHQGRDLGLLFTCGYSARELSRTRIGRLRGAVADLRGRRYVLEGERVPVLGREDQDRLFDLLEYAADEAAAFEAGLLRRPEPAAPTGAGADAFADIVAHSAPMRAAIEGLREAAPTDEPVLLQGEPGTGKRALARALHQASTRRAAAFEVFEGSPDPLTAEHRLFGQIRGGSLGRVGAIERAGAGTLYLCAGSWEEAPLQVQLARYLREGTLVPAGAAKPIEAEARLVLAMEEDFDSAQTSGRLRRELAARLAPRRIRVPPLRARREDLPGLIGLLLERAPRADPGPLVLSPSVIDLLVRYDWPGNAAELEEEIRQLVRQAKSGREPTTEAVSMRIRQAAGHGFQALSKALGGTRDLREAVAILERELIHEGLVRTRWNKSQLARELGISRSNLLAKLERYGLESPKKEGG